MKTYILTLLTISILSISCTERPNEKTATVIKEDTERYTGPIIDMHLHAFPDGIPIFGTTTPNMRGETYKGVANSKEQKEKTLEMMKKNNIVRAVVTDAQLWFDKLPESILNGGTDNIEVLRKQFQENKLHVIGELAPFYDGLLADDPSMMPYYELAEELDIPVGFHILPGGPENGFHLAPEMFGKMRVYNANPLQLENILVKFPKLRLYIMHGGWPYIEDVKALLFAHSNVNVDIAAISWGATQQEVHNYVKALFDAGFGNRIMFGTDQMVWPQVIDVAIQTVNTMDFLNLEQKEDIFYDNAAKFLRLTDEEIKKDKQQ